MSLVSRQTSAEKQTQSEGSLVNCSTQEDQRPQSCVCRVQFCSLRGLVLVTDIEPARVWGIEAQCFSQSDCVNNVTASLWFIVASSLSNIAAASLISTQSTNTRNSSSHYTCQSYYTWTRHSRKIPQEHINICVCISAGDDVKCDERFTFWSVM